MIITPTKSFIKRLSLLYMISLSLFCGAQNPIVTDGEVIESRIIYEKEGERYMPDPAREKMVKYTMKKASEFMRSISTKGGYAATYSEDLSKRYGEGFYELALPDEIFTQYPGTPAMGELFLRSYNVTKDEYYLARAYDAGKALVWGQRSEGGWDHLVDVSHYHSHLKTIERKSGNCTYDDNITQGVLSFLIELDAYIDDPWLTESIDLALAFILKSQADNGAWPQWYPSIGSYHDYWTFNDDAMNNTVRVLIKAHQVYGRKELLNSINKAGNFIIKAQVSNAQPGWAQQYDHDLKPGWGRRFEPPGVCSSVTASTIALLADMFLYTKNENYLKPIPAAIEWLESSKLEENLWARIYELKTNKPLYGQHDRRIHYLASEGRTDYNFQGSFGIRDKIGYCQQVLASKKQPESQVLSDIDRRAKIDNMMKSVQRAIAILNTEGYWLDRETGMINLEDFVDNMNLFCEHLELKAQDQ
ncbi:MAG: pectate lyase [Cyclobacteriaceae bacterium]